MHRVKIGLFLLMPAFVNCVAKTSKLNSNGGAKKEITVNEVNSAEIAGLWRVDAVKQAGKKIKVKAFYFFGLDSTFMYSPDSIVRNNLIQGYKYFVRNDSIYTLYSDDSSRYIYKDETKVILEFGNEKMSFKSVNNNQSYLTRIRR